MGGGGFFTCSNEDYCLRGAWRKESGESAPHGQISYKNTKTKCRLNWCLIEFIDWSGDTVSHVAIFDPDLWTIASINFSLVHLPPPLPPSCGWEGVWGGSWVVLETIFCRSLTLCSDQIENLQNCFTTPKQKPRRGGGHRQVNTCRKVSLQVIFLR